MTQDSAQAAERPSLYDRLGGVYNIAPVVDDLIDRVMTDPRLNANPRVDEAHHRSRPRGSSTSSPRWYAGPRVARNNTRAAPWAIRTATS
jgi:hypothetical protein